MHGSMIQNNNTEKYTTCRSNLNEIPFLQLAILYLRVLRVYIDVGYIVDFVERR